MKICWIYNHVSLGQGMLATALRLHRLGAYLFMLNSTVYVAGLVMGGGWRSLLSHRADSGRDSSLYWTCM
jgi:thiosulfate reductase cytochrome b subunit